MAFNAVDQVRRKRWRACWQCPCEGNPGAEQTDSAIAGARKGFEQLLGHEPVECAWWHMRDPVVHEVLALYRACRTDQGATPALILEADPPAYVWQGLLHYVGACDRLRANELRLAREAAEKNKPRPLR